jgi:hypothetical protein
MTTATHLHTKSPLSTTPKNERRILRRLMDLLNVSSSADVFPTVSSLVKQRDHFSKTRSFIDHISAAVTKFSPPDVYNCKPLSLRQIWKWIRRLIEEYMGMKRAEGDVRENE